MTGVGVLVHGFPADAGLGSIARRIEDLGYDSVWSGDHLLKTTDGLVACAAFAAATEHVTVGTAVYLPQLRGPVAVARMLATVAAAGAAGRFVFGVGAGGDVPAEFEVTGVDIHRRGALLDAFLDRARTLFEEDPTFVDHGALPTVWAGGRSPRALRRGLEHGEGFAPYLVTVEQFSALAEQVPAERAGFQLAPNLLIAIDTDEQTGSAAAAAARPFDLPPELVAKHVITGSPAACAARLAEYVEAGATHLILNLGVGPEAKDRQLAVMAEEIVPLLHATPESVPGRPVSAPERRTQHDG